MALLKLCCAAGCEDLAPAGQSHCVDHEARRQIALAARRAAAKTGAAAQAGSKLYQSVAWRDASKRWLKREPMCRDCAELGVAELASEVDHIEPHRGDPKLFWRRSNWQSLCKRCHSRKTAKEVFSGRRP